MKQLTLGQLPRPTVVETTRYFNLLRDLKLEHGLTLHTTTQAERFNAPEFDVATATYNLQLIIEKCPKFHAAAKNFKRTEWERSRSSMREMNAHGRLYSAQLTSFIKFWGEFLRPTPYDLQAGVRYRFFSKYGKYKVDSIRKELADLFKHEVTDDTLWAIMREYMTHKLSEDATLFSITN